MPDRYVIMMEPPARWFFEHVATHDEQTRIGAILAELCEDPFIDDETKFPFEFPPTSAILFSDGQFWVVYEVPEAGAILVLNIGFEEEIPSRERNPGYP